jgi:hypothetical protein
MKNITIHPSFRNKAMLAALLALAYLLLVLCGLCYSDEDARGLITRGHAAPHHEISLG